MAYATEDMEEMMMKLEDKLNTMWVIACSLMVMLSQVGYMMKETGTIKMQNNNVVLLKTTLVISTSSLGFFFVGYGFSQEAEGGILGESHFAGGSYVFEDYIKFIYYLSLCC